MTGRPTNPRDSRLKKVDKEVNVSRFEKIFVSHPHQRTSILYALPFTPTFTVYTSKRTLKRSTIGTRDTIDLGGQYTVIP